MKKIINIISGFILAASMGLGFASWTFSSSKESKSTLGIVVKDFIFRATWTNSDVLPDPAYNAANEFAYAVNNPNTPEGKAWTDAWKLKHNGSGGNQYVGSMGNRGAGDDFAVMFSDKGNYIAVRHDANSYSLYVTYETLNSPIGTVQPVYKTLFTKNADGTYSPSQSWVGRCNRNIYYITQATTYAFDTESFKEI